MLRRRAQAECGGRAEKGPRDNDPISVFVGAWVIDVQQEQIIPVLKVKDMLPVSTMTLRRWVANGKLETIRAGARVYTSKEAVQRLVQQGSTAMLTMNAARPQRSAAAAMNKLRERLGSFD